MNNNTFNQQQKISNFNAIVKNNNDKIAIEFLTLAKWDETEAIKLYLNNVSLPNNSSSNNNENNQRIIRECKLNLNDGFFKKAASFFKGNKDNADYCKDFEGKIRGLVKRGDIFINLLKINKGVIILYNIETKNKLMQQLDMINKDPENDYLNGVIIFPIINKSEEGGDLIKQLSINRFPCYLFCKYKTKEIVYIVDKMEGIFYLNIFKDTLSPKINIINNSSINLQPNNNNYMPNNQNIQKNYKSSINLNSNKNLITPLSNMQTNKNNYKINDVRNNNNNNNVNNSINFQQNNNQNMIGKNINNNNSSNNNNLQNINKECPKYNDNKEAFPKDIINNYSSLNNMDNKESFSSNNKSNNSKNENNNNINNNNQSNNNNKDNKIVNNDNNLNNKQEVPKNEKKEYIPDYRDYDLDDELVYNPQLDRYEKLSNVINKLDTNSNKNNNNNYSNINNNMYNFQNQNIPISDRDIRNIQDTEMKELEKIEEEKLRKEKEEKEKKRREEQKEKERIAKEKEEKELFSSLIPPEPDDNNPDKCIIIFRLPDGKNIERKFLKTDKISLLYDYIRSLGKDIYTEEEYQNFSILQTFPPKNFEDKLNKTLEEEGLFPNSMLQIKENN